MGTKSDNKETAILTIFCPDCQGIIAAVSAFLKLHNGNIIYLDQHVDKQEDIFFMRIEWILKDFAIPKDKINQRFQEELGNHYQMRWNLQYSSTRHRMAIFVSKLSHCLYDILARSYSGEWQVEIPLIISNHEDMRPIADQFGIDYHVFPITKENKKEQEKRELELLAEYKIDFIVFARYMQIVTESFIQSFPNRIVNIHHSFLPAFPGARPYHSAYKRGVKIIGATAHYVTIDLDAGPIIVQDTARVSHKEDIPELLRRGRDLEKLVLSRAIWHHLQHKVLVYGNRTVIFD